MSATRTTGGAERNRAFARLKAAARVMSLGMNHMPIPCDDCEFRRWKRMFPRIAYASLDEVRNDLVLVDGTRRGLRDGFRTYEIKSPRTSPAKGITLHSCLSRFIFGRQRNQRRFLAPRR